MLQSIPATIHLVTSASLAGSKGSKQQAEDAQVESQLEALIYSQHALDRKSAHNTASHAPHLSRKAVRTSNDVSFITAVNGKLTLRTPQRRYVRRRDTGSISAHSARVTRGF